MPYTLVENDTGIELQVTCTEADDTAVDLTGCTVLLRWKDSDGDSIEERSMTVTSASEGKVSYIFDEGEIVAPLMSFELQITDGSGRVRTSLEPFTERVRPRLSIN